jgi:hypothetical protein
MGGGIDCRGARVVPSTDISAHMRDVDLFLKGAARQLVEYRRSLGRTRILIDHAQQQIEEVHELLAEVDRRLYSRPASTPPANPMKRPAW